MTITRLPATESDLEDVVYVTTAPAARMDTMRLTRLDDQGNPTGPTYTFRGATITMTTDTKEHTTMPTKLDPSDPASLTDAEAAALATRPTKHLVATLLQELRTERELTESARERERVTVMDLRTSEDDRKAIRAQLDADPEARLVADMEAAITAYGERMTTLAEGRMRGDQYGAQVHGYAERIPQPYQPALDSPLGRAILHVAQRHGIKVEATTVFPEPQGPSLAVIPPHLASAVQQLVDRRF